MHFSTTTILVLLTLYSVVSAAAGVLLLGIPEVARRIVPFSGAVLILISIFWVLPELASIFGWPEATALLLCGSAVIYLIDKHIYPVCPACAHTHNHAGCVTRLHGFAGPLIIASLLHSLFDGWALSTGLSTQDGFGQVLTLGIAVHRLPEGLAFGVILRAALNSRGRALLFAALTQSVLLIGGLLEMASASYIGSYWIGAVLALGGGMFLYLGFHAVHGEWKRRVLTRETSHSVHQ